MSRGGGAGSRGSGRPLDFLGRPIIEHFRINAPRQNRAEQVRHGESAVADSAAKSWCRRSLLGSILRDVEHNSRNEE